MSDISDTEPPTGDMAADPTATTSGAAPVTGRIDRRFHWWLAAAVGLGLVVRLVFVIGVTAHQPIEQSDAYYYSAQAVTVGDGRGFVDPYDPTTPVPRADHPPLTAIVAAPATWVGDGTAFGQPLFQVLQKLTMALIGCVTIAFVGLCGRRLISPTAGIAAALFAAINPNLWINDGLVMSEAIGAATVAISLYLAVRVWDQPSWQRWAGLGVSLGFCGLARAEALALVPLLGIPMALMLNRRTGRTADHANETEAPTDETGPSQRLNGPSWRRARGWLVDTNWVGAVRSAVVLGVGALVVVAPWVVRNMAAFDKPVTMSTNDGLTLLGSYCAPAYEGDAAGYWILSCIDQADTDGDGIDDWTEFQTGTYGTPDGPDPSVYSEAYRQAGVRFARAHLSRLPDVAAIRVLRTWGLWRPGQMADFGRGEYRPRAASLAAWGTHLATVPLVLLGLATLRRRRRPTWPFLSQAVAVTIISALFYGQWRFRIGWDVAACVLVGVGLTAVPHLWHRLRERWATPQQHPTQYFPTLDGYRALAAMSVVVLHVAGTSGADRRSEWGSLFTRGDIGLSLFFVLSGFLVSRPFLRAYIAGSPAPATGAYYRRRALRIMPAYLAAFALIGVAGGLTNRAPDGNLGHGWPTIGVTLAALVLLNTFRASTATQGLPQGWSLGVEASYYVALPVGGRLLNRLGGSDPSARQRRAAWALVALGSVGPIWRFAVAAAHPRWGPSAIFWLPSYLDVFALGMLGAAASVGLTAGLSLPRPIEWLSRRPGLCLAAAISAFLVVANPYGISGWVFGVFEPQPGLGTFDAEFALRISFYAITVSAFLLPGVFGTPGVGWWRRFLASGPMVFLGRISYGIYLWHVFWLWVAFERFGVGPFNGPTVLLGLLTLAGTLPSAAASYYLIERPLMKRLTGRSTDSPPAEDGPAGEPPTAAQTDRQPVEG